MRTVFLLLFLFKALVAPAQKLSPTERKIIDAVNKNLPRSIQLLKELVDINSGTLNTVGVKKVGSILSKEFDAIHFTTEWISLPDSLKRAGHLVAYKKGSKGKKLF